MKYHACIAAVLFGIASVTAVAAESTDKSQQATPEAARGGEPANSQDAGKTTGGQQSDANAAGEAGKRKTGQASSAEQTDAQTSQQGTSNQSGDASPEASRKTGQAASANDSNATSTQNQGEADAAYSAELKKCDSMQGDDKERCITSAKKKSGQM